MNAAHYHQALGLRNRRLGDDSHCLDSRYCTSLEQARKAVAYWQTEFNVAAEDVHDNSMVDLDDIFSWMDVDLSDEFEGKPWSMLLTSAASRPS